MDTDWCLFCNRQTDGTTYCSSECQYHAQPPAVPSLSCSRLASCCNSLSSSSSHGGNDVLVANPSPPLVDDRGFGYYQTNANSTQACWVGEASEAGKVTGKGDSNILAWAQAVPMGAPPQSDISLLASSPTISRPHHRSTPSSSSSSAKSSRSSTRSTGQASALRKPSLLLSQTRPVAPTLCVSTVQTVRPKPSLPILTKGSQPHRRHPPSSSSSSLLSPTPPDTDEEMEEDGLVPDYVFSSAANPTCVGVAKAATSVFCAIRSWVVSSPMPVAPLKTPALSFRAVEAKTKVTSPPRPPPVFPTHKDMRVSSPLHLPDEDLRCDAVQEIPYPSPSSMRRSVVDARSGSVRRPVGVNVEREHPAFLGRGRKRLLV